MSGAEQYKESVIRIMESLDERKLSLVYDFVLHLAKPNSRKEDKA